MQVIRATKDQCDFFVRKKHYSRKPSIFWAGFALVENGMIEGVAVYGQPSPPIQKHAFTDRDFRLYELCRVVVQSENKNAASFLIGQSLRMLTPRPCAVISYADEAHGHCGIIYQATNWLYTGATVAHDKRYLVDGEALHPMTLRDRGITNPTQWAKDNGIEMVPPARKHRYFYLCGTKSQKAKMLSALRYPVVTEYPKRDKTMYDAGRKLLIPANDMQPMLL